MRLELKKPNEGVTGAYELHDKNLVVFFNHAEPQGDIWKLYNSGSVAGQIRDDRLKDEDREALRQLVESHYQIVYGGRFTEDLI